MRGIIKERLVTLKHNKLLSTSHIDFNNILPYIYAALSYHNMAGKYVTIHFSI